MSISVPAYSQLIPKHLEDVRILQENVLPQDNSYRHKDSIVEWKGYHGATKYICHTDCSGLVDALLVHSYHLDREKMREWLGKAHAKAQNYFRVITEQDGFEHIRQIKNVLPGDFVAMKFLPGFKGKGHDTGHIMIVNQLPQKVGPRVHQGEHLIEWSVEIIDCTRGHGKTDTRYRDGSYHSGIGKGVAALYTDNEGILVGYSWTPGEHSIYFDKNERPMVVGRYKRKIKRINAHFTFFLISGGYCNRFISLRASGASYASIGWCSKGALAADRNYLWSSF